MLSDRIQRLGSIPAVRRRTAKGTTTLGRYTPGTVTEATIQGLLEPIERKLHGDEVVFSNKATHRWYTTSEVTSGNLEFEPDFLEISGEDYRVVDVTRWVLSRSVHYRASLERVGFTASDEAPPT